MERKWLITGATGQLGSYVARQLADAVSAFSLRMVGRRPVEGVPGESSIVDLTDADGLQASVNEFAPTHIIHMGGITSTADAFRDPDLAHATNVEATRALSDAAASVGARFVFASTDMVFDGTQAPYAEDASVCPLSVYGQTKLDAERVVSGNAVVVRLPLMYGLPPIPRETTFTRLIAAMRAGEPMNLFTDEFRTPVWLADGARAIIRIAESDISGTLHIAGPTRLSRYEMGQQFAAAAGIAQPNLVAASRTSIDSVEPRAEDLSMDCSRFREAFPDFEFATIGSQIFE